MSVLLQDEINLDQIAVGDHITGLYFKKYGFSGIVEEITPVIVTYGGNRTFNHSFVVKLTTDCQRPGNGLFNAGDSFKIIVSGDKPNAVIAMLSKPK
jgi:hypothetical protein